jgi:hypothetical protein
VSSPSYVSHRISALYFDTLKEADVSVSIGMRDVLRYWIAGSFGREKKEK